MPAYLPPPRSSVILGVPFHDVTMSETLARLAALIERREPVYWATANLDFAYQASQDVELQRILIEADLVLCDGTPLVWASRALGAPLRERVAGSDLAPRLAAEAATRGWRLFLLGGAEDSLRLALQNLRTLHPSLHVEGFSPPFASLLEMDNQTIEEKIRAFRPDILLVAFGCPKQEKWIYMHHRRLGVPVSMGVGATVYFLAGKFRRAPAWMRTIGAEWIFRLAQEPRRLFQRYLLDLLFFVRALRAQRRALASQASTAPVPPTPSPALPITRPDIHALAWTGRADAAALAASRLPLPPSDFSPGTVIALDLSQVTFLDSSALGALLGAYRRAVASGGGLALVRPSPPVRTLLTAMKLDRLFVSVEEPALAASALGFARPTGSTQRTADELILPLQGELTSQRVSGLATWIEERWNARPEAKKLVLDLTAVRFMDSSGLGLLLRCHRHASTRPGASLALRNVNDNIRNVIRVSRVDSILRVE